MINYPHNVYRSISLYVDQSESSCSNKLESPHILKPNEAYACVVKQNKAYETSIAISGQLNPVLKPNEAYESVTVNNNPIIIYEEVVW